jgi:serine/threonine-protein kinase
MRGRDVVSDNWALADPATGPLDRAAFEPTAAGNVAPAGLDAGPDTTAIAATAVGAATTTNGTHGAPAPAGVEAGLPPVGPAIYDEQPPGGRRRKRWIVGLVAALIVIAAGVAGVIAYQRASVPSYPVPPLVGVEIAKARNIVSQYDWKVEERSGRSDTYGKGLVYQQEPVDGSLERGDALVLYVSEGPFPAKLPGIVGKTQAAAKQLLTEADLVVGTATPQFDETAPAEAVLSWTVNGQAFTPGTEVPKGTVVDLVISAGPQPRKVPKLVGVPYDQAVAQLQQLGLVPVRVEDVFSDGVAPGGVAATDPGEAGEVAKGGEVKIAVSKGPDVVTVPNVIGMDLQTAVATLNQGGLAQGTINGPIEGKVIATNPGPTAVVKRGTAVEIAMA